VSQPRTARVTKEDKHDVLREIHMSGMNYRIMHSNLDQMIADSAAESARYNDNIIVSLKFTRRGFVFELIVNGN
jgi:hypothetical protein